MFSFEPAIRAEYDDDRGHVIQWLHPHHRQTVLATVVVAPTGVPMYVASPRYTVIPEGAAQHAQACVDAAAEFRRLVGEKEEREK